MVTAAILPCVAIASRTAVVDAARDVHRAWDGAVLAAAIAAMSVAAIGGGGPAARLGRASTLIWPGVRGLLPVAAFSCVVGIIAALGVPEWTLHPTAGEATVAVCCGIATVGLWLASRWLGAHPADAATAALVPSVAAVVVAAASDQRVVVAVWCAVAVAVAVGVAGTAQGREARVASASPWLASLPPQAGCRMGISQVALAVSLASLAAWLLPEPTRPGLHVLASGLALLILAVPLITLGTGGTGATTWRRLVDVRRGHRPGAGVAGLSRRVVLGHAAVAFWPLVVALAVSPTLDAGSGVIWPATGCLLLAALVVLLQRVLEAFLPDGEAMQSAILSILAVAGLLASHFWGAGG